MSSRARLLWLLRRDPAQRELDEEIRVHLELEAESRMEAGASADEARTAARRDFGNIGLMKETARAQSGLAWLESLWQDIRYAARGLVRDPRFTAVATLSLALGIGANTAIFSLVRALILRSLPVANPDGLVELVHEYPGDGRLNAYDIDAFEHLRDHNRTLAHLVASSDQHHTGTPVRVEGFESERRTVAYISGDYFLVLGVRPAIGRLIGPQDDTAGGASAAAAVISWSFWKSRFEGNSEIVGKQFRIEDQPMTIVGVAPPEFFGIEVGSAPVAWASLALEGAMRGDRRVGVRLLGRLKAGVSPQQAQADLDVLFRQTLNPGRLRDDPLLRAMPFLVVPAPGGVGQLRDQYAEPLVFLMMVVGLLLLIACTNVASMLLARGATRGRELALRASLGAGRLRLARMTLTEGLFLSVLGALLGVAAAYGLTSALVRIMGSGRRPVELTINPDATVLLFTAAAMLCATLLFGSLPALRAMATAPQSSLRSTGKGGDSRAARAFRKSMVVAQVSLSVLLLSAASLFLHHLSTLRSGLGFEREGLLLIRLEDRPPGSDAERLFPRLQALLQRLETIPGVRSASMSAVMPLSGAGASRLGTVEGYREIPGQRHWISLNWVGPGYFETLGTPLLAGRDFSSADAWASKPLIVNEAMARYYFGDGNPLGKRVTFDGQPAPYEIVGVVADAKYQTAGETPPHTAYLHASLEPRIFANELALRTSLAPAALAPAVRQAARELLPDAPVQSVRTMEQQVDATVVPERLVATLAGAFGALGALLAAIGLYGLLGYMVARRTNEIGIRAALGATTADAIRMVLAEAGLVTVAGLTIGTAAAFWARGLATRVFAGLEVEAALPILIGTAAILLAVLPAACAPALRAARVDPMEALRIE